MSSADLPFVAPDFRDFLDRVAAFRAPADVDEAVALMRRMRGVPRLPEVYPPSAWTISEHHAPFGEQSVRVLVAQASSTQGPPAPVLFVVHGGGLISGSAEHGLVEAAHLVDRERPLTVVAVDYGLAPETGFGTAVRRCSSAIEWVRRHADSLHTDPERMVVVGQSAGGAVATSVLLTAPTPVQGLLLSAPMLDEASTTWSMRAYAGSGTWDRAWNEIGWAAARRSGSRTPAPAAVDDVSALQRVFVDVGTADALLDETVTFAQRLWRSGADVELHVWAGAHHGFDLSVPEAPVSRQAQAARRQWLARTLSRA